MIVVADTSGLIAATDSNSPDGAACRSVLHAAGTVVLPPLVLAEVDHVSRARFGGPVRRELLGFLAEQVRRMRFHVPETTTGILDTALAVIGKHADLDLDLADAVTVVLAADYRTDAVLTLDRRDFRAIRPLTPHPAFRVLPDDA